MHPLSRYFLSLLFLLSPVAALAQPVDIVGAVKRAVADRPSILADEAQTQAAASAVRTARSRYLPQLGFSETFSMTNEPAGSLFIALNQEHNVMTPASGYQLVNPDPQHDFETRLTLEQTIYSAETGYWVEEAGKRLESAKARRQWGREVAGFSAFQSYLGVQRALADLQAVEAGEKEAIELLRLAVERHQAGIGLKADELRARAFRSEVERRTLSARNNLVLAQQRLAIAIGQEGGEVEIAVPFDGALFDAAAVSPSEGERPDLQAFALDVEALAIAAKRSQADYLPRIDLAASYGLHHETSPFGADGQSWRLGVALNWKIFDGFRREAAITRASAEKVAFAANLSEARREQTFRRREVQLKIDEARAQKRSANEGVDAALEGHRLLRQRYESGLTDLVDLLATQNVLDQARLALVAAEIQLLSSLGQALLEEGCFVATILAKDEVTP